MIALYRCRVQTDLYLKVRIPAKGNMEKIANGEVDAKSKGLFLIKLCFDSRGLPVIAEHPAMLEVVTPQSSVNAPSVFVLDRVAENFKVEKITIERIEDIHGSFYSINISPNHLPIDFCYSNMIIMNTFCH